MKRCQIAVLLTVIVLLGGVAGWPQSAGAQVTTIRFGHVGSPGSLFYLNVNEYAKRVNEALTGRVEVKVFHSSQLGTDEQMIKGIRVGAPEMFLPSTIMSTVEPKYGVFEMPYIIFSRAHMKRVSESAAAKEALLAPLPAKGVRILAFWENGFRHITNNVRSIVKPEDLKGIKLRVPGGVWRVKMFKAYGANPSPMPLAEVYSALQSGVMDAQENPFPQIWGGKFHEVQKYLSLTGHLYTPAYPMVNEAFWQRLPADVRTTMEKIAGEMGDVSRQEGERLDRELQEKIAQKSKINEVDKEAFIKASAPVYEEFGKEVPGGGALITLIQSLR